MNEAVFSAPGGLNESGAGVITAGGLSIAEVTGSATLNGNNAIGILQSFRLPGDFSLTNSESLVINGLSARNVTLNVAGAITETQPLLAASLSGSADRVSLIGANQVLALGSFSAPQGLALTTTGPLTITGPVNAGTNQVALVATGGVTETGAGAIAAGDLSLVETTGGAALNGNNAVDRLQDIRLAGDFSLTNNNALIINGLSAQSVMLNVAGAITETQPLLAASLSGSADRVSLSGANQVLALASFSAPQGLALTTTGPLTITGPVNAGTNQVALVATGGVTETGAGAIAAGDLSLVETTGGAALNGNNAVGRLQDIRLAGDFSLTNNKALVINGLSAQSVMLNAADAITETSPVATATLGGSANSVSLTGANQIGTLGSFSARDNFILVNTGPLSITGPVSTPALALRTGGNIGIQGDVRANTLELDAAGTIVRTGGALVAGTVSGSGLHLVDFGTAPQIANRRVSVTGSEFALQNAVPLTILGPLSAEYIRISAPGSITLAGNILTRGVNQTGLAPLDPGSYLTVRRASQEPGSSSSEAFPRSARLMLPSAICGSEFLRRAGSCS